METSRVLYACTSCSSAKAKCGLVRPCQRCSRKGLVCIEQQKDWITYTATTKPAQALARTSDQNLNTPQSRDDEPSDDSANLKRRRLQQETQPLPRLPEPQRFYGFKRELNTWLPSIKAKLQVDGAAIGDAYAQFFYVYLMLDRSVQAKVLTQVSIANEAQEWDYNSILDQLVRVYGNPNKQEEIEEAEEAEDSLYALRQGNDSSPASIANFEGIPWPEARAKRRRPSIEEIICKYRKSLQGDRVHANPSVETAENFNHNTHVPVPESQLPGNENVNLLPSPSRQNTLTLNISLKNRVANDSTRRDGRGELQQVGQFQPTSLSQIQTRGKESVEEQAQNNSELVDKTPRGGEVGYMQREVFQCLEQQESHTPGLSQHHQEKPWEEALGFHVANYATLSPTNPSQPRVGAFQLPHVVQIPSPSQRNFSASPNSEPGPMNGILRHPGELEPMNSTLADSLHMPIHRNMLSLWQSNGYVYCPPATFGFGPVQNEDGNIFLMS